MYMHTQLERLQFIVSKEKGVIVSSDKVVASAIQKKVDKWDFVICSSSQNLGVDFGLKKNKRASKFQRSRLRKLRPRVHWYRGRRSSFRGAAKVARVGGLPAAMHGAS
eukprot:7345499-Pyramimonas_sp.AAC.1